MAWTSRAPLLALLVALATLATARAFIVEMEAHSQECYYEYVRTKRTAYLKVGVLESQDQYDIRLKAYGPFTQQPTEEDSTMNFFDQLVISQRDEVSNDVLRSGFNFESEHRGGFYKFCLDNTHSAYNGKIVEFYTSFDLSNEDDLGFEDQIEKYAREEHIAGATTSLNRLRELLDLIKSEQLYYKSRERRHRQTVESNNSRLMWYTVLEIGTLALIYGAQSFFLHKWFSDRGMLAKRQWGA